MLATALLLGTFLVAGGGTAQAANPDTHRTATWNMQNGRDRWAGAYTLARTNSVVALQEVPDTQPAGAVDLGLRGNVRVYRWQESSRDPVRYLHVLDQNSQNLGIITSWWPDDVLEIPGVYRSALAVGTDTDGVLFASIHASADGGSDAASLVRRVAQAAYNEVYPSWAVLGDFNRSPGGLRYSGLPLGSYIYNAGQATQRSGGELDYMVANVQTDNWQATVGVNAGSDHWPVHFGSMRGGAEPRELTINPENADTQVLDVYEGQDRNGTHVIIYHPNGGSNQRWRLFHIGTGSNGQAMYRVVSSDNNKCLDVQDGLRSRAGSYLNIWDCHNVGGEPDPQRDTQNFTLEHPIPTMPNLTLLRNNATGLYANIEGGRTGDGTWVIQWPDQIGQYPVDNETFYLHPTV
ncbi:hypothetical protein BIV24_08685 [Streptomyces colonosanans]|uniref:Ricin B lectin domain-containing protein n=1 Tax=Streptomyces colonosanans TaxID=1428652 RepID=A0A1S2PPB8_9ACTN|nr:hypothetical protein BIV24_08685 [Streptomyces colonosanans]